MSKDKDATLNPGEAAAPLPAIAEHDATGEVARLYADIKTSLGIPAVNLVWRHLATIDGALPWVWGSIRPLYVDGILEAEADSLRDIDGLVRLPPLHRAALRTVGVGSDDESVLRAVFANYDQSNAVNLLAFMTLLACLRGEHTDAHPPVAARRAHATTIATALPKLLSRQEMTADSYELGRAFLRIGAHSMPAWFSDSVGIPRHLAHWPGFLALCVCILAPWDDAIADSIQRVHERAAVRARVLMAQLDDLPLPTVGAARIVTALEPFTRPFGIASIIPKVRMLRLALAAEDA